MKQYIKPPLGLLPRSIVERMDRINDIRGAIYRYINHEEFISIPPEWITEYNILIKTQIDNDNLD